MAKQKFSGTVSYLKYAVDTFRGEEKWDWKGGLEDILAQTEMAITLPDEIRQRFAKFGENLAKYEQMGNEDVYLRAIISVQIFALRKTVSELRLELARCNGDFSVAAKEERNLSRYDEFFAEILTADSECPELGLLEAAQI